MSQQTPDESVGTAIALLLLGVAGGLGLDLCAKALLADYSLEQFVLLRSLFGLLIFLAMMRRYGGVDNLRTGNWQWHLLRTLLASGAMFGFFFGFFGRTRRLEAMDGGRIRLYRRAHRPAPRDRHDNARGSRGHRRSFLLRLSGNYGEETFGN